MTNIDLATPTQLLQHKAWKVARERLSGMPAKPEMARPDPPPLVLSAPGDRAQEMYAIVYAVAKQTGLSPDEITTGLSTEAVVSARGFAMALCIRRAKLPADVVAEYFGVEESAAHGSAILMDPILCANLISHKTPLYLGIPMLLQLWKEQEEMMRGCPTVAQVQKSVAVVFDVSVKDICSALRTGYLIIPRHVGMSLCRRLTKCSLPEIGRRFGGRDHTTVHHAVEKMAPVIRAIERDGIPSEPIEWAARVKTQLQVTAMAKPVRGRKCTA